VRAPLLARACAWFLSLHRLAASRQIKTRYGCPIIGENDMQGEQCKLLSFAYLPAGDALLYSRLRSITVTEVNAACLGR
jgi:hypothetical protein